MFMGLGKIPAGEHVTYCVPVYGKWAPHIMFSKVSLN